MVNRSQAGPQGIEKAVEAAARAVYGLEGYGKPFEKADSITRARADDRARRAILAFLKEMQEQGPTKEMAEDGRIDMGETSGPCPANVYLSEHEAKEVWSAMLAVLISQAGGE